MVTRCFSACAVVLLFAATACTRPAFAPRGINVSSDRSDYAPTARLAVALGSLNMSGEPIDIVMDSGSLAVPGDAIGGGGGDLFNVYLTALVVTPIQRRKNAALLSPMRLRVPRPHGVTPADARVVSRLTGSVIRARRRWLDRHHACADWNLNVRVDRKRSRVMNACYLQAC